MLLTTSGCGTVDASPEHAALLLAAGWVRVTPAQPNEPNEPTDLTALTVAQLRELCGERGIDAPKRTTKAQLVKLLSE